MNSRDFSQHPEGFDVVRRLFSSTEIRELQRVVDQLVSEVGTACVRGAAERSEGLRGLAYGPRVRALVPEGYRLVRSLLFDKVPGENWPVAWHQDRTIAVRAQIDVAGYGPWSIKEGVPHVQPPIELLESMVTLRIHLDDAPLANGALRVIPGSHRHGWISPDEIRALDDSEVVDCECRAGDVMRMAPLILHASRRSERPEHRRVVHFEFADPAALDGRLDWATIDD